MLKLSPIFSYRSLLGQALGGKSQQVFGSETTGLPSQCQILHKKSRVRRDAIQSLTLCAVPGAGWSLAARALQAADSAKAAVKRRR